MVADALTEPSQLTVRAITFKDETRGRRRAQAAAPARDRIRFTPRQIPSHTVDEEISKIARHYGHTFDQVDTITLILRLLPVDAPNRAEAKPLTVTVRRDPNGKTYTARVSITQAWGHGESFGEAFHDCLDDLAERS